MFVSWQSVEFCRCTFKLWLWQMKGPRSAARSNDSFGDISQTVLWIALTSSGMVAMF